MNLAVFYNKIRFSVMNGKLTEGQVNGIETILKAWEDSGATDNRWLAYILATAYHETGGTMQPVNEIGKGKGRAYGEPNPKTGKIYYGRGHVQLTWLSNYSYWAKRLGRDLVNNPDDALLPSVSAYILVNGMIDGSFTGKKLSDYFPENQTSDILGARRIINGTDKTRLISTYYTKFLNAII